MMVRDFASRADKYGGTRLHSARRRAAAAAAASDTASLGTAFWRADEPSKADGNARMLERENQPHNWPTWNCTLPPRRYSCPARGLQKIGCF